MSTRSLKAAAAASVLALALLAPSAFAWGGLELEKNCSNGLGLLDTTQCSYNVAAPTGEQDVDQGAINANVNIPVQLAFQDQDNDQDAEAKVDQRVETGWQIPVAVAVAKSGKSEAYGHEAIVDIWAPQYANAGIEDASMEVESDTGSADVEHSANGDTTAFGPNTGNYQEAKSEIKGEDAYAEAEKAIAPGGDGGSNYGANGGDVKDSSNGGWAVEATLALSESEGGNGGNGGGQTNPTTVTNSSPGAGAQANGNTTDPNSNSQGGTGGAAGTSTVAGGNAIAGAGGTSTAGAGGNQWAGAGAAGGTATNIALAKNVGDNANAQAWNSATSGNASMGNTYGNMAQGGSTGNNCTSGTMQGGSAANVLGVAVTQSGNVSSYSGTATQNGNPTADASTSVTQTGTPSVSQSQNPSQGSTNTGGSNSQTSGSTQSAGQTVTSGAQTASGTASGLSGNTVTVH